MSDGMGQRQITEVDARGLDCPMPLLKAKRALNDLASGGMLRVLATDSGSQRDFAVFAEQSGHQLLEASVNTDGEYVFLLKKR